MFSTAEYTGMGLFNDAKDFVENIDFDEPHEEYGFGFDPDVCEGCPHHETDGRVAQCGLCGCATQSSLSPMVQTEMPPSRCPRLDQHENSD